MVLRNLVGELPEAVHRAVRSLPFATRIRISNKSAVEEWIEDPVDRMVHEPVAHARFVNVAGLRVADLERAVVAVPVCFLFQIATKREYVVHQAMLEFLYVFLLTLPFHKLLSRRKQILDGNDIVVGMSELDALRVPPPNRFCRLLSMR